MADLFQEVDDIMRQERMTKFWKDNAPYIIAFVLGTILLTAAVSGYRSWDAGVKEKQTQEFLSLQDAENYPENLLTENLDMRAGLRGITYLLGGNAFMQQDKIENALTLYQKVASDKKIPEDLRGLGALMAARIGGPGKEGNKENVEALLSALKPIAGSSSNPWAAHAHLEIAVLLAHGEENYEQALAHLNAVLDAPNLPDSMYNRANALQKLYTSKASQKGNNE